MKTIFVYNGSRRHGNTEFAIKLFVDRLQTKSSETFDVKYYSANSTNIAPCIGCCACFTTGKCSQDHIDSFDAIKEQMLRADLVIIATPVYAHSVSGDTKIFIDRLSYWLHLFRLAGKLSIILTTSSSNGNDEVNTYLTKIMEYLGTEVIASFAITIDNPKMLDDSLFLHVHLPSVAQKVADAVSAKRFKASERQERYFKSMQQLYSGPSNDYEGKYWNNTKMSHYTLFQNYVDFEVKKG